MSVQLSSWKKFLDVKNLYIRYAIDGDEEDLKNYEHSRVPRVPQNTGIQRKAAATNLHGLFLDEQNYHGILQFREMLRCSGF